MVLDLAVCQVQIIALLLLELSKLLRNSAIVSLSLVLVEHHAVAANSIERVHYHQVMATRDLVLQASGLSHFDQQSLCDSCLRAF